MGNGNRKREEESFEGKQKELNSVDHEMEWDKRRTGTVPRKVITGPVLLHGC